MHMHIQAHVYTCAYTYTPTHTRAHSPHYKSTHTHIILYHIHTHSNTCWPRYRLAKCVREEIDHFLKGGKLSPALFGAVDPDKLYVHCLECIINITTYQYHM